MTVVISCQFWQDTAINRLAQEARTLKTDEERDAWIESLSPMMRELLWNERLWVELTGKALLR